MFMPSEISHRSTLVQWKFLPTHFRGIFVGNNAGTSGRAVAMANLNSGDNLSGGFLIFLTAIAMLALIRKPRTAIRCNRSHPLTFSALN